MVDLPPDLLASLPAASVEVARRWWATLSEADRSQVAGLWDRRREAHFFAPQADEAGTVDAWDQTPAVAGGRFLAHDDSWRLSEWGPDYFEYLLDHPEVYPISDPAFRTFHIGCTQHPAARACLKSGHVPPTFRCPVDSPACPLEPLRGARLVKPRTDV